MKKRLFTLLFALMAMVTVANAQVVFNATNFPDPNFRAALMEQVRLIVYSHNSDGECIRNIRDIREGDVIYNNGFYDDRGHFHEGGNCSYTYRYTYGRSNKVDYSIFDIAYKSITNLTGIEHFTILEWLECYDNQLTSLDVSQNTALKKLSCDRNQLTSLDVSGCTALKTLSCGRNQLTSLDVSKNAALTELMCGYNQLTSLDVSKNTALTLLSCDGNPLTSLDVSKNAALTELYCLSNQLTSLDVSKNAALTTLYCSENQLTSLDVSQNAVLDYLSCNGNQLTSLDVSKNAALTGLNCSDNQLTSLDVSGCTALTSLFCDGNQLTSLDVSKNASLTHFWCSDNQLTAFDVSKNTALKGLSCANNRLTSLDVSKNTALTGLHCYGNQIKGEAMDALVASLPIVESGRLYVINTKDENEGNICTKAQVAVAKEKGWTVYDYNYDGSNWVGSVEYEGSDEAILLDEENFPDDNFRNAIAKELGLSEGSEINEGLIVATTKLDVSDGKITELSGIEYFTALTTIYCQINQISDKAMTSLIGALPDLSGNEAKGLMLTEETNSRKGALYALDFTADDEQNVCTAEHVAAANAKGWTVYCKTTNGWQEYTGEVPTGIGASLNDNGKMINDSYYSIDGVKLSGEPRKKGVYILKGKKVVK